MLSWAEAARDDLVPPLRSPSKIRIIVPANSALTSPGKAKGPEHKVDDVHTLTMYIH